MTTAIITIMPNYCGAYAWLKPADVPLYNGVGANVDGYNLAGVSLPLDLIYQLEAWQAKFERFDHGQEHGWLAFDWVDFHKRGIALAARVKTVVGDTFIVIYEKAFEDPCHHDAEQREVFADGTYKILPSKWRQQKGN